MKPDSPDRKLFSGVDHTAADFSSPSGTESGKDLFER